MDSNHEPEVRNPSEDQGGYESEPPACTHVSAHVWVQTCRDLAQVVTMWPWVSAKVRKAILTLLNAAQGDGHDTGAD